MILPTVATESKTSEPIQSADDQGTNTGRPRLTCRHTPSFPCRSFGNRSFSTDARSDLRQLTGNSLTLEEIPSLPGSGQPTDSFTISRFASRGQLCCMPCSLTNCSSPLSVHCSPLFLSLRPPLFAQPAFIFFTVSFPPSASTKSRKALCSLGQAEPGKFIPAPMLKTDVSIAVTGIIARATVRQEFTNPSHEKDEWARGHLCLPSSGNGGGRPSPDDCRGTDHRGTDQRAG